MTTAAIYAHTRGAGNPISREYALGILARMHDQSRADWYRQDIALGAIPFVFAGFLSFQVSPRVGDYVTGVDLRRDVA